MVKGTNLSLIGIKCPDAALNSELISVKNIS